MPDNLKTVKSALAKIHQDMESISRMVGPSYLSVKRTLEPIRRQQLEISRALELSGAVAQRQEIVSANQHWQDLIKQATATRRTTESLSAVHPSWLDTIKPIRHDFSQLSQLRVSAKLALCDTSLRLAATERFMAGIDFEAIRGRFHIEMPVIACLESSIVHVAASYKSLAESIRDISDITRLPPFVLPGATREIYTTSFALETLRPLDERNEEDAETEIQLVPEAALEISGCIALLQQVDPELAPLYTGACNALYGNNVDHARHILISLRELWGHLLWRLAPNDLVTAWIAGVSNQNDLLHEGKPTRRARVLYVCRELNTEPMINFLMHDTQALVKFIELLNRVHDLNIELTDKQLKAILINTNSWLYYILQI